MVDTKITDATAKTTIVDSDEIIGNDVADGNTDKKFGLDDIKTYMSNSPTLVTPALGTPASGTMTNVSGASGITGLGTQTQDMEFNGFNIQTIGVLTIKEQAEADGDVAGEGQLWVDDLAPNVLKFTDDVGTDFTIANTANKLDAFSATTSTELRTIISDETGTGGLVFANSPTLVTPALGTPASGIATNLTGTSGITGLGTMTTDIEMGGVNVQSGGVIFLREQAEADADVTAEGQIWVDTQTPNKLFFTNDAGTDFELGAVTSLTPWTEDVDADGFDLNDLSNIEFRDTTAAPADSTPAIWGDAGGINYNVPSGDNHDFKYAGLSQMTINNQFLSLADGISIIWAGQTNRKIVNTSTGTVFEVQTSDTFDFEIENVSEYTFDSTTFDMKTNSMDNVKDFTMDNNAAHILSIERNAAITDDNIIGELRWRAHEDVGGTPVLGTYGQIIVTVEDESTGTEDSSFKWNAYTAGTLGTFMKYNDAADDTINLLKNTKVTGTLDVSGILDTLDIETATVSARDGSLAITIADSTGVSTFVSGAVLVAPVLGTPASGVATNLTGTSAITGLGTMTADIEMGGVNIQSGGVIFLKEQAEADADVEAEGQIWVDTATPNKLFFTDDAGTDFELGGGVTVARQGSAITSTFSTSSTSFTAVTGLSNSTTSITNGVLVINATLPCRPDTATRVFSTVMTMFDDSPTLVIGNLILLTISPFT